MKEAGLPVVDLLQDEGTIVNTLRKACSEFGFFYLKGHGIPEHLMASMFGETKKLFDLPVEEKQKLLQDRNNRGYTPFEEEILDPSVQTKGDTKEGFYIGIEIPAGHELSSLPLHGPNQWPDEALLPSFRPVMSDYYKHCLAVSLRLVELFALCFDLPRDFFLQPGMFDYAMASLRLLHYSSELSSPPLGVLAAGAHSDYGMLTLLAVDSPGLEICRDRNAQPPLWEDVSEINGALVVNIGDMMERWTNGKWLSTLHRVVNKTGKERYSAPFFFDPNFTCKVECLPTCQGPHDPPKYPPCQSGNHILDKYNKTHQGFGHSEA